MRPQGDMVAFTVMTIVEKDNTRHREIWLQPLAERQAAGARLPVHVADGEFDGSRGGARTARCWPSRRSATRTRTRTWFVRVGATGGEAFHVDGVQASRCGRPTASGSPTSRHRARRRRRRHGATRRTSARAGSRRRADEDARRQALRRARHHVDALQVQRHADVAAALHARKDVAQIFVVPAEGGTAVQLTRLTYAPSQLAWTPDSDDASLRRRPQPGRRVQAGADVGPLRDRTNGRGATRLTDQPRWRASAHRPCRRQGNRLRIPVASRIAAPKPTSSSSTSPPTAPSGASRAT